MKNLRAFIIGLMFLIGLGLFVRQNSTKTPTAAVPANPVQNLPAQPTVQAVPETQAAERMPPDSEASFAVVNQQRLQALAGQPYNGPSYKIEAAQMDQMVAEHRQQSSNRLPASADQAPAAAPAKKHKKRK